MKDVEDAESSKALAWVRRPFAATTGNWQVITPSSAAWVEAIIHGSARDRERD